MTEQTKTSLDVHVHWYPGQELRSVKKNWTVYRYVHAYSPEGTDQWTVHIDNVCRGTFETEDQAFDAMITFGAVLPENEAAPSISADRRLQFRPSDEDRKILAETPGLSTEIQDHLDEGRCLSEIVLLLGISPGTAWAAAFYDTRQQNDFSIAGNFPHMRRLWSKFNGARTPDKCNYTDRKIYVWNCPKKHYHTYRAEFRSQLMYGCVFCHGGRHHLFDRHPVLAQQFHQTMNLDVDTTRLRVNGPEKVWWVCPVNHTSHATVKEILSRETNCPHCQKELSTWKKTRAAKQFYSDSRFVCEKSSPARDVTDVFHDIRRQIAGVLHNA